MSVMTDVLKKFMAQFLYNKDYVQKEKKWKILKKNRKERKRAEEQM